MDAGIAMNFLRGHSRCEGKETGRQLAPITSARVLKPQRSQVLDLLIVASYGLIGLYVTAGLWLSPGNREITRNWTDQALFEFMFSWAVRVATHGELPLYTDVVVHPDGVNMMANTSMLAVTMAFIPVTVAFGPAVSFALLTTACMVATAGVWYYVFRRHLIKHQWPSAVAAGLCGFGPAMVSHSNGHPNQTAQFLVPFLGWYVIKICTQGKPARHGLVLGALVVVQIFINEEALLLTAMFCGFFVAVWAARNRPHARQLLKSLTVGLGTCCAVAVPLLAYPLWYQFFGPQSYHGLPWASGYNADAMSYLMFPTDSLAGRLNAPSQDVGHGVTEENSYFGIPLVLAFLYLSVRLRADKRIWCVSATAAVFVFFSFGDSIVISGTDTFVPGPWSLLSRFPLLDSVMTTRLSMVLLPVIGFTLAVALARTSTTTEQLALQGESRYPRLNYVLAAVVLVPLFPVPVATAERVAVPSFVSSGQWREYVDPGGSVVSVRLNSIAGAAESLQWTTATGLAMPVVGGNLLRPNPDDADGAAQYSAQRTGIMEMLDVAFREGILPDITDREELELRTVVSRWNADVFVADERDIARGGENSFPPMVVAMNGLLDVDGRSVGGVWVWDVRHLSNS